MSKLICGERFAEVLEEPGYELRLRWTVEPYAGAPLIHWQPREHHCESGPEARIWFHRWMDALVTDLHEAGLRSPKVKDIQLSRRKVGEWESK